VDDPILISQRHIVDAQSTPFKDALDKLGTSGEGFELDAGRDAAGHIGATVEATKDLGRGWSVAAAASWAKDLGYAAMGKLTWKPK
jgi:hypothetical protein